MKNNWIHDNQRMFKHFLIFLLFKTLSIFIVFQFPYPKRSFLVFDSADTFNYITGSIDILKNLEPNRLPIYSLIISLFRLISDSKYEQLLVISQLICAYISIFIFYIILQKIISQKATFYTTLFFAFVPYFSFYDVRIMTETYSTFLILCSVLFFYRFITQKNKQIKNAFFSGLFLAIAAFLKTIYLPLAIIIFLVILFNIFGFVSQTIKRRLKYSTIFISSFLFFELIWIGFNFYRYKEVIIISKSSNYQDSYESMENYYGSMWLFSGLNFDQNNWENVTQRPLELDIYPLPKVKFPSIISFQDMETNFFNKENLKAIQVYRETVPFLYSPNRDFKNKLPVDSVNKIISSKAVVFNKMNLIIESLKNEHPIKSRFLNKFSVLLLIVNQDLFAEKYYHQPPFAPIKSKSPKIKWIKIIWNISYSLSIFFGVLGSITLLFFSKNKVIKLLSLLSFYLLFIYVFSWLPEWRYILASLPFFIMTGGIFIEKIYLKIKTRDYSPTQSPSLSAIR